MSYTHVHATPVLQYYFIFHPRYERAVGACAPSPVPPELRLESAKWGAPLFAIGFFWFGCASTPSTFPVLLKSSQMDILPKHSLLGAAVCKRVAGHRHHLDLCTYSILLIYVLTHETCVQLALCNYIIGVLQTAPNASGSARPLMLSAQMYTSLPPPPHSLPTLSSAALPLQDSRCALNLGRPCFRL